MDKRINNGGHPNSGRKPKVEEARLIALGKKAIKEVYGSEKKFWKHIAEESEESIQHLKILTEYIYGKPKETQDITINKEEPLFTINVIENNSDKKTIATKET